MEKAWTPEFTDFEKSPYTGLTRESWKSAAKFLLGGIFSEISGFEAPVIVKRAETEITYPHKDATGERLIAEQKAEIFEGLTRSFFIASVMIHEEPGLRLNGIKLADYYKEHILRSCTKKDSPEYVGTYDELFEKNGNGDKTRCFQQTVETCALVIGLSECIPEVWDTYTREEKDSIAAFLRNYAENATVPQNWRLFCMLDMAFLYRMGYDIDETVMADHVGAVLNYYAGDGWYRDGQCFDYYSCWAFNFYGPLWCDWYGYENMPYAAQMIENNSNSLMRSFPDMFDDRGFMNMWGRSCIYRFAATSAFDGNLRLKNPEIDPGLARRIASGCLLQFMKREDFLENGVPSIGFYGRFTPLVQGYSCAESPFWLGKAFLCLAFPAGHPFWTEKEAENSFDRLLPGQIKETILNAPGLDFTNHKDNGETVLRTGKIFKTKTDVHGMENYGKLSYNTAFPWEAETKEKTSAASQAYYLFNGSSLPKDIDTEEEKPQPSRINALFWAGMRDNVLYRRGFFDYEIHNERHWVQSMYLADFPVPLGIMRVDRLGLFKRPVTLTLGSYGFPNNGTEIKEKTSTVKIIKDCTGEAKTEWLPAKAIVLKGHDSEGLGITLAMTAYAGFSGLFVKHQKNCNPDSERSVLLYAVTNTGEKLYDGSKPYMLISQTITRHDGKDLAEDEIFPLSEIRFTDKYGTGAYGPVEVVFKDGNRRYVDFTGVEGNLML